jgi:hypothetical protein
MNNTVLKKIDVTDQWQALSPVPLVASVTISALPTNAGNVLLRNGESQVELIPGEWQDFRSVNLAELEVKGTIGDVLSIVGGTWWCVGS